VQAEGRRERRFELELVDQGGLEQVGGARTVPLHASREPAGHGLLAKHRRRAVGRGPRQHAGHDDEGDRDEEEREDAERQRRQLVARVALDERTQIVERTIRAGLSIAAHELASGLEQEDPPTGVAAKIEEEVRGEATVAVELQHVVDEDARVADRDETPLAHGPREHHRVVFADRDDGLELGVEEDARVVGDDGPDTLRERVLRERPRHEQLAVAPQAQHGRPVGARIASTDAEDAEEGIGAAEVVGNGHAPPCAHVVAEIAGRQLVGRVDDEESVRGRERAEVDAREGLERRVFLARDLEQLREPVPLRARRREVALCAAHAHLRRARPRSGPRRQEGETDEREPSGEGHRWMQSFHGRVVTGERARPGIRSFSTRAVKAARDSRPRSR
jgi:hypothetical protein